MHRHALILLLLAPAARAEPPPLPAFWVYGLCRHADPRCLPLLHAAYDRAANAPGGTYAPITYCVQPAPPDEAMLRADFLRIAGTVPAMLDAGILVDRMEAFVLQRTNPCGLATR